jgi:ABC-type multidrug transport system ATPase subunit/DNA-binding beta-propeller fold protein YncE
MSEWLWTLRGVWLGGENRPRLDGVSLEIGSGVTAVLGQSGAGKTSLLNLLVGFEKPDAGEIISHSPIPPLSHSFSLPLFWVPQDEGLWHHLTVREHLEAVSGSGKGAETFNNQLSTANAPRSALHAPTVLELLKQFDLTERAEARPDDLSQGERARLSVARALAANAAVLVMDEPLVHVDSTRVGKYWAAIREHVERTGASLIFSTHSPQAVMGEAQRVICLRDGKVLYAGEVEPLYWQPTSRELAECLGETNWLAPDEARLWLRRDEQQARSFRPEQISVAASDTGECVVESSRFHGSVAEARLRHEPSGATKTFFHRPSSNHLAKGARVALRVLTILLLCFALAGCDRDAAPKLAFSEIHYWSMPSDGPRLPQPRSVAIAPNGDIVALDRVNRVLIYDANGTVKHWWRMPDVAKGRPEGVTVLKDGSIVVCDTHYSRVVTFSPQGTILATFGSEGTLNGQFIYPVGITKDTEENLYVCEYGGNDRVQKFTRDGKHLLTFGAFGTGAGEFQRPSGILWHEGKVYIADAINNRIEVYSDDGKFLKTLGGKASPLRLNFPYDVTLGGDGVLYVIEYGAGRLSKITFDGQLLGRFGEAGQGTKQFYTPWGLASDGKLIVVADTGNRRLVVLRH